MAKKQKDKKPVNKYIYVVSAVLVVVVAVVIFCLNSCEKEPVIGYDPPTPQEWLDELEAEKNRTDTEVARTYDLDGIWQHEATGKYYQAYMGHIFELASVEAGFGEYFLYGTQVAYQKMEKDEAEGYGTSGGNPLVDGETIQLYLTAMSAENELGEATLTIIDAEHTKVILADGSEHRFRFIEYRDEWPEGYR